MRELAAEDPSCRRIMHRLREQHPPIEVSDGVMRQWLSVYYKVKPVVTVRTADELNAKHGEQVSQLSKTYAKEGVLVGALSRLQPPIVVWLWRLGRSCILLGRCPDHFVELV